MGYEEDDDDYLYSKQYYIDKEKKELEDDIGIPLDYQEELEKETTRTTEKTIEKVTEKIIEKIVTKTKEKKERIIPEGQKDLNGNDASNINFGDLVTRNVMRATHDVLKTHLILFPSFGFKNEISGLILYGPNGTGKTEFCSKLMTLKEYSKHCDFEIVDIYHLIDSKMGATSEKVSDKFKEWIGAYKKKNRIQVKIIDEGEMIFLQKKDKGSKAYSELSNSMLKHTGKFNGVFVILITNDIDLLNKGAISRFDRVYWPPLDSLERNDFMKDKFEKSEIKVDMKDFDKIEPYLRHIHFGDIRTHNKLMSHIKGWYVQNHQKGDIVKIEELVPLFIEFNEKIIKDNEEMENAENKKVSTRYDDSEISIIPSSIAYPEIGEMIDYCINNCQQRFKDNYVKLKDTYEMRDITTNQLEVFLKPSYKKLKLAENERNKN